jgi:hypothetical protein
MWLVYLRFDDQGVVRTYHIRTGSRADVDAILTLAEQRGLAPTAKLVEYAAFMVSGTIKLKPMLVPNFHFYAHADVVRRWHEVGTAPH